MNPASFWSFKLRPHAASRAHGVSGGAPGSFAGLLAPPTVHATSCLGVCVCRPLAWRLLSLLFGWPGPPPPTVLTSSGASWERAARPTHGGLHLGQILPPSHFKDDTPFTSCIAHEKPSTPVCLSATARATFLSLFYLQCHRKPRSASAR